MHLQPSQVIGLGRLLVRWVGLPLIWIQQGKWLNLGFFITSLWIGVLLVMRDVDPEPTDSDSDGFDGADCADGPDDVDALPTAHDGLAPASPNRAHPAHFADARHRCTGPGLRAPRFDRRRRLARAADADLAGCVRGHH